MGAFEWGALSAIVAIVVAIGGVVVRLIDRINKVKEDATAAARKAEEADGEARSLVLRVAEQEKALTLHRISIAENYVSVKALESVENKIMSAIHRIGDRLDKFVTTHT